VTVAHGTRQTAGNETARELTRRAGERLGWPATASYVELAEPLFADVVAAAREPVVAVPLLLSTGFHMTVDLPEAVAAAGAPVTLGRSLGPDPALARAQVARLREAGATPGQRVVLVAAGSSDEAASADQAAAVALLAEAWGGPVALAAITGRGARPADVVRPGDAVSPYLLSTGFFVDKLRRDVPDDVVVADVLGVHDEVVALIEARARALA
jgi:sirohydrochlorin ferrochelatase